MSIGDKEYFSWYNEEINRYRDHEWQVASFSLALSSAIVIFAKNNETKDLICPLGLGILIIVVVILLMIAEIHTHIKLNQYRKRRELLIKGKEHKGKDASENPALKVPFFASLIDAVYTLSFIGLPVLFGFVAAWVLIK
jgi:hypothetical protein